MMAPLAAMVARQVSCSTLPLCRLLSRDPRLTVPSLASHLGLSLWLLLYAPHAGIASNTRIQFWRTLAASVHRVSQLHTGIPLLLGDSNIWFPFFQLGRSRQADAPLLPIVQEILQSHSLVFRNPPDLPTHSCGAALDIILSSPSLPGCVTVHSGSNCCSLAPLCCSLLSCHLDISQASLPPNSTHSSLPRLRDWSTVVAACHHSLSTWHQSVLALTFLRVLPLWTLSSTPSRGYSLTVLPFTLVVAPGPAHAQGNLSGGVMRATTLLLLATALGVTFVALAHMRIRLVSASCANSSTAQSVPPGPTTGTSGLVL